MAKTIKFNLICNSEPVRTIDDLQNNFSIEDVLAYYKNRLLHRWLEVRGYKEELKKVSSISSEEPMEIIKSLISIFDVVTDEKEIEEGVYILKYLQERQAMYNSYGKQDSKMSRIFYDYEEKYGQLVERIIDHPKDASIIKATIHEITSTYEWVLALDHRRLFYRLLDCSPLAIMCLLMNEESRKYYLPLDYVKNYDALEDPYRDYCYDTVDKQKMYEAICAKIKERAFLEFLGDNLLHFAGETEGYWKDLEPKGKKCMIIGIWEGTFVRSAGVRDGDLGSDDILNKFVITDGVDYKSNTAAHSLRYMEV